MITEELEDKDLITHNWTRNAWMVFNYLISELDKCCPDLILHYANREVRIKLTNTLPNGRFNIAAFEYQSRKHRFKIRTGGIIAILNENCKDIVEYNDYNDNLEIESHLNTTGDITAIVNDINKVIHIVSMSKNYYINK